MSLPKICGCSKRAWSPRAHAWHFSLQYQGTHHRQSLNVTTKPEALTAAAALMAAIRSGRVETTARPLLMFTLAELFELYDHDHLTPVRTSSRGRLRSQIAIIVRTAVGPQAFGDYLVDAISLGTIEQFRSVRRVAGAVAVNRDLALLRALFAWAIRLEHVARTPFKRGSETVTKLTRETARSRRLDPHQSPQFLAAAAPPLRAIVIDALETGLRRGDILSVQWQQVRRSPRAELFLPAGNTRTRKGPENFPLGIVGEGA